MGWGNSRGAKERASETRLAGSVAVVVAALLAAALAGCSGPMDQSLVTNSTQDAYRASFNPVYDKLTAHQQAAFDWAVTDFDLAKLNAKYPNASPKAIVRGEVQNVLDTYPARIKALESDAAKTAPLREDLGQITADAPRFYIDKNFFGLQPTIKADIINRSSRPVSQLQWNASLFLDDATTPVAQTVLTSDYRSNGGMKPGDAFTSTFKVGFLKGDERWTTLEIRNAAKTRVVMEPVLDSVLDFGDRPYLAADPAKQIENLSNAVQAAKTFTDI